MSEGLSAVYKFETRIGSGGSASQGTNQLYAGLSGGFGSLTLGKFHNAAYNGAGAIRDIGYWYSSGDAKSKVGDTVSYAFSSDAANFQVDAIMDGAKDSGRAIDQVQFGVSVSLGEIGKVGLGYENVEDYTVQESVTVTKITGMATGSLTGESKLKGNFSTEITGAINNAIENNGNYSISLGSSNVVGSVTAMVSIPDYDNDMTTAPMMPRGECRVFNSDGGIITTRLTTSAGCTVTPSDQDGDEVAWTLNPNVSQVQEGTEMLTNDGVVANLMPEIMLGGTNDVEHMFDGNMVTRQLGWEDATGNACDPDASGACNHVIQYLDGDTVVASSGLMGNLDEVTHTSTVNFDASSLMVKDGTLVVMQDGAVTTLENVLTVTSNTDGLGVEINSDDVTVDHDGVVVNVDGSTLTGKTTTSPKTSEIKDGYKATHVSVQLNLGAMTLGLGYSEKESNKTGSMDQKTTYLGASGSIGDTGMGWRAWTRDISNRGNKAGDANPWGIGINKDLGGGAFTFVEHHNNDDENSGSTIVALGVNF